MVKKFVEFLIVEKRETPFMGKKRKVLRERTKVEEVQEFDPDGLKLPQGCAGFRFFKQSVINVIGNEVKGEAHYQSWYYLGEDLSFEKAKERNVISDDQYKEYDVWGYHGVVLTPIGKIFPLTYSDKVIPAE